MRDTPLMSASYFAPVAWVAAVLPHRVAYVEAMETFPKQTYRSRMEIMTAGGVRTLAVPTLRNNHTRMGDVGIDYRTPWPTVHLRTLTAAYAASPYFLYYRDTLEQLLNSRYERLLDFDLATARWLLRMMHIDCRLEPTTDWEPHRNDPLDLRQTFSPKRRMPTTGFASYCQVFADRLPFAPNLSALDLLMNLGPESRPYLENIPIKTLTETPI